MRSLIGDPRFRSLVGGTWLEVLYNGTVLVASAKLCDQARIDYLAVEEHAKGVAFVWKLEERSVFHSEDKIGDKPIVEQLETRAHSSLNLIRIPH